MVCGDPARSGLFLVVLASLDEYMLLEAPLFGLPGSQGVPLGSSVNKCG